MRRLHIKSKICFEATTTDGAISIVINKYVPYVATAIHAGSNVNNDKYALSISERYYEEDPHTSDFITGLPITLIINDSRYFYDLNRDPNQCIYTTAWGKKVWLAELTKQQQQIAIQRHQNYYDILFHLLSILDIYEEVFVFDIHSYNYKRIKKETPTFNLGTYYIKDHFSNYANDFLKCLKNISISTNITAQINSVFEGRGYQAKFVHDNFKNIILFPLEIKKIYMDELTGEAYPTLIEELSEGLQKCITDFMRKQNIYTSAKNHTTDQILIEVDKELYNLAKEIEILNFINPTNYSQEKDKFFKDLNYNPQFQYNHINIDPFEFREKLYSLPVSDIKSPILRRLYREVINTLALDIDLVSSIGKESFLYNSLRVYGEPNINDIKNAQFLLYAPEIDLKPKIKNKLSLEDITSRFEDAALSFGLKYSIKLTDKIVAKAMVNNSTKQVLLNKHDSLNTHELESLVHHELGVHALTTENAEKQLLSIFKLGLPGNTHTQEGLAIYNEYLSGNLTLDRLKELALRVIAVDHMLRHQNFRKTYDYIKNMSNLDEDSCFRLITRVYRGGGFTKDYLYLSGLRDIIKSVKEKDFNLLFIGKTSLKFIPTLKELYQNGWISKPYKIPETYQLIKKPPNNNLINYLIKSIR